MSKACQDSDIPWRIIQKNADIFTDILHSSFNNLTYQFKFPSILQLANITPVFKKDDRNSKENYRPVSILLNISKIFLEKWKNAVDKGKCFRALLRDLFKAFECLSHEQLIVKLHAHGFDFPAVKFTKVTYQTENKGPK